MQRTRTHKLINALVADIQATEGRRVTDKEVAAYLRIRPSTVSKWRNGGTQLEQLEILLRLLERLPEERWLPEFRDAITKRAMRRRKVAKS